VQWFRCLPVVVLICGVLAFPLQGRSFYHGSINPWAGFLPTCSVTNNDSSITNCPSNIRFRDFSTLTPYASNPVLANNQTFNTSSQDGPFTRAENSISGTFYNLSEVQKSGDCALCFNIASSSGTPLSWTFAGTNPVINGTGTTTWDSKYLLHPSLTPCSQFTWCAYYGALDANGNASIGFASATNPLGPYTKQGQVIDCCSDTHNQPALPSVIHIGSQLVMYVAIGNAGGGNTDYTLDYYTSSASDGVNWTRQGTALQALNADFNSGYNAGVFDPFVFKNSHGFYEMVYTVGSTPSGLGFFQQLGYAVSADGFTWYKYQAGPIFNWTGSASHPNYAGDGSFYEDGTTFYFCYAFLTNGATTNGQCSLMADH
jgi:hypothetical protein